MCCSDDDCDPDILMMVLRCIAEQNKKFVARVIIGIVFDGIESLSMMFKESDETINTYLIVLMSVLYVILIICIVAKNRRGKDVYKFNYVFSFKCVSLVVAFIIFNTTSSFDWNTIEQLYTHLLDWNFQNMFLTALNIVSFLDIILNFFSLIFLFFKIHRAVKEGKGTYSKLFYKRFELLSKFDEGTCERPNQQSVFSVNAE